MWQRPPQNGWIFGNLHCSEGKCPLGGRNPNRPGCSSAQCGSWRPKGFQVDVLNIYHMLFHLHGVVLLKGDLICIRLYGTKYITFTVYIVSLLMKRHLIWCSFTVLLFFKEKKKPKNNFESGLGLPSPKIAARWESLVSIWNVVLWIIKILYYDTFV